MKKLIILFILVLTLASCNKPKQKMSIGDVKQKYGIDLLAAYENEEIATARGGGKGSGKVKPNAATIVLVTFDLELTATSVAQTTTCPTQATFGGVQKAFNEVLDSLQSACNWYLGGVPNTETVTKTCNDLSGAGTWYRSWFGDESYNVHLSQPKQAN